VDSTALNGRWNGHLPSSTAVDGHNWMFPVAFGFFESETEDNWKWFMQQLRKAIGDLPVPAVCSDSCKGLTNAMRDVFPNAEKRECFRHLMNNFVKQFPSSEYMYPDARAYRKEVYDMYIANVKQNPAIADWLDKFHSLLWYRSAFNPSIKCDYVTNNIAEVFNNWIKDYKDLPVCDLADKIRLMIMQLD
jgi:transposase-like protein